MTNHPDLGPYRVEDIEPGRRIWLNTLDLGGPAHTMYGLLEVDVTTGRRAIADHKARTGESLSFTGFLVHCLARAVAENPAVQTYRKGRRKLLVLDDVHVGLMVEHATGGKRSLMGHVIRNANRRTVHDIHDEIRHVQTAPLPKSHGMPGWFRRLMLLPWPLSWLVKRLVRWFVRRDPTILIGSSGTVFVTSVGMFGGGHAGWGITTVPTPLSVVVGGIAVRPRYVDGRLEPRDVLDLTLLFDHDVIDGAPATRFVRRLVELIESGYGLDFCGAALSAA